MDVEDLDENKADRTVLYLKMAVPALTSLAGPLAGIIGPILTEALTTTIPNQRIDRIALYLKVLRDHLPDELLEQLISFPDRLALVEEGLYAAGLTGQRSRVERLAHVVSHGLPKEEFDIDHETHLLTLVRGLSDADVVVLKFHSITRGQQGYAEFVQRNSTIIPNNMDNLSPDTYHDKVSLFRSHITKLAADGLLDRRKFQLPKPPRPLDRQNEQAAIMAYMQKVTQEILDPDYRLTSLGRKVLTAISSSTNDVP